MGIDLLDPSIWAALLSLTVLEIVLGIDNIVFLAVLVSRLPEHERKRARALGLALAFAFRIILLFGLVWVIGLTKPIFSAFGFEFSWRDLILIGGGLFLLAKGTHEIHRGIEGEEEDEAGNKVYGSFAMVITQIAIVDLVFSLDSIITAIGIADHVEVMIAAIVIAMIVMYVAAAGVSHFIEEHPTTKMLALAFLLLIGLALVADGFDFHIPRGYIYFAMAFAGGVEVINVLASKRRKAAKALHRRPPA